MYEAFVFMCTPNIPIYVGMMSGTSMDGVDAVACVFNEKGCQFIARSFEPYSNMLRESLLSLCQTGPDEVFRMQNGANEIAKIYAKAFNKQRTELQEYPSDRSARSDDPPQSSDRSKHSVN